MTEDALDSSPNTNRRNDTVMLDDMDGQITSDHKLGSAYDVILEFFV